MAQEGREGGRAKEDQRGKEVEKGGGGGTGFRAALLITAQKLHSQGDALVPLPGKDADISAIEGWFKDVLFVNVVVAVSWEDLVCSCFLILHYSPGPSIITVGHFKSCNKLDGAKVFGPLCDNSCDFLGRFQVHLQPLRSVVGGSDPGIGLALFVQPGVVRVPSESLNAPGAEGAGGRDLAVGHQSGLHAHRL